jgi:hypothetical protein
MWCLMVRLPFWGDVMFRWFLVISMLFAMGCMRAHMKGQPDYDEAYGTLDGFRGEIAAEMDSSAPAMRKSKPRPGGAAPPAQTAVAMASAPPPRPTGDSTPTAGQDRMVFYDGYARLRVSRADDLVTQIEALVAQVEGRVERLGVGRITIRVPVAQFEHCFAHILGLGEVVSKSVSAADVTDAFTAVDLRLQTAQSTLARLRALLAKAKEEEDKIRLLREIQRLTEQIDRMEVQRRTLASLASMSRISVDIEARDAFASNRATISEEAVGMEWIGRLSPFSREDIGDGRAEDLVVPKGMVDLEQKRRFIAESADGVVLWTAQLSNEPQGDATFWMDAIQRRLGPEFAVAEVSAVGAWTVVRLVDVSDEPYTYLVGLRVDGRDLHLVQVYFPSPDHEDRYGAATLAVLGEVQG